MIEIQVGGLEELSQACRGISQSFKINLAAGINKAAKKTTTFAARELKLRLAVPVWVLKKAVRAKGKATKDKPSCIISLNKGYPIPLKYFGAKQNKKGVVTYKVDPKKGAKKKTDDTGAFIPPQYGGRVYRRTTKKRLPLEQLYGPDPGVIYLLYGINRTTKEFARQQVPIEIKERIRVTLLRNAGKIAFRKGLNFG